MSDANEENDGKKVEVLTTNTCPYCDKLKNWLKENNIDFVEYNANENREKAMEMINKTGSRGVPQVLIGNEAIVGFQPDKIKEALEE